MYPKRDNRFEVLKLYAKGYDKEFYLREISKLTKIPVKTIQNTLFILEKENLLKSRISGRNKYFYLNLDNAATKLTLIQTEIYKTKIFLKIQQNFCFLPVMALITNVILLI